MAVSEKHAADKPVPLDRPMILLGFAFAAAWVVTAGMAAHFPRILEAAGASTTQADRGRRADRTGPGRGATAGSRADGAASSR